jgi:hypothetical protein
MLLGTLASLKVSGIADVASPTPATRRATSRAAPTNAWKTRAHSARPASVTLSRPPANWVSTPPTGCGSAPGCAASSATATPSMPRPRRSSQCRSGERTDPIPISCSGTPRPYSRLPKGSTTAIRREVAGILTEDRHSSLPFGSDGAGSCSRLARSLPGPRRGGTRPPRGRGRGRRCSGRRRRWRRPGSDAN